MTKSSLIEQLELTGKQEMELSNALVGLTEKRISLYIGAFKSLKSQKIYGYDITRITNTLNEFSFADAEKLIDAIDKNFYIPYFFYNYRYSYRFHLYISNIDYFNFTHNELLDLSEALSNWFLLSNNTYLIMQSASPKMCLFTKQLGLTDSPLDCKKKSIFLKVYHGNIHLINNIVIWIEKLVKVLIYFFYFEMCLYALYLLKLYFKGDISDSVLSVATIMTLFLTVFLSKLLIKILQVYRIGTEPLIPSYRIIYKNMISF